MEILKGPKFNKFISDNRESTLRFLKSKYDGLSYDDVEDIYQESKTIRDRGKNSSIRLDDFSTEMTPNKRFSEKRLNDIINLSPVSPESPKSPEYVYVIEEMKYLVKEALSKMPTKCQNLLRSYYFDELSWSVIADKFDIKGGADSAKVQASKCRKGFDEKNQELKRLYNLKKKNKQ